MNFNVAVNLVMSLAEITLFCVKPNRLKLSLVCGELVVSMVLAFLLGGA